jgi:carbonic anhydrase
MSSGTPSSHDSPPSQLTVLPEDAFHRALTSNSAWAQSQTPEFLKNLAAGQAPKILWLGCSDSRAPETTILGLQPGEVFVHRNIANIISPTDINSEAVIEYSVAHLKVQHIVLCGHTSCGGAVAALGGGKVGGVLDTWLTPLKQLVKKNSSELEKITDGTAKARKLAELNVAQGVEILLGNHVVQDAIKERGLKVHGAIFNLATGKVEVLEGVGKA